VLAAVPNPGGTVRVRSDSTRNGIIQPSTKNKNRTICLRKS